MLEVLVLPGIEFQALFFCFATVNAFSKLNCFIIKINQNCARNINKIKILKWNSSFGKGGPKPCE